MRARARAALVGLIIASFVAGCSDTSAPTTQRAGSLLVVDLQAPGERICMPDSEFNVGGSALGASQQQVIAALGAPDELSNRPNQLDDWVDIRLLYNGLSVDFLQDEVVNMSVTAPQWRTPSGMSVGMSEDALLRLFGVVPPEYRYDGQRFYEVYFCRFNDPDVALGTAFRIFIDDTARVSTMTIYTDTP